MNLPTGTITFLFTDIEGSTKLWEAYPEAMRLALERHDQLLRATIKTHFGHVFKTVGDAFCAAFPTASDGLNAALEIQLALHEQEWKDTGPLRVRMGLHTGTAEERNNDYFGPTVNRVARLQGIGHGQQILLSQTTYTLISACPAEVSLIDLGLHRLKDLVAPENVWQLNHPALPREFPPLKSLDYLPNNLPLQVTSFIGREKQMEEIKEMLHKTRLLTLTGSGGCGKTRLALQVAADRLEKYKEGVWLVELAPLADPALVPQTVADALSLREAPGEPITKTLLSTLKDTQMLLVLDNCEHLLEAAARLVEALIRSCPNLTVLVTSREALGIAGEQAYRVPSLSLPEPATSYTPERLLPYEAVHLFIERAVVAQSNFAVTLQNASSLASVCRHLDGIPLAIELAAARIRAMPLEQLEPRLDNRFRLLTGGSRTALPRQQTLKALIDWSYDLLNAQEKALLCRLSVFAGGWTLEAAERVGSDEVIEDWEVLDLLTSLVDKSLVVYEDRAGTTRYRLLETVREYARERLEETGETEGGRLRHRDYFLGFAEETEPKLRGAEQAQWLQRVEEDHENLRAALAWSNEIREEGQAGLRLASALGWFWMVRGYLSEGRAHLEQALSRTDGMEPSLAQVVAMHSIGMLLISQGNMKAARPWYEQSLALNRQEVHNVQYLSWALHDLGLIARDEGDYTSAEALMEEAFDLMRVNGIPGTATLLFNLGRIAISQADYPRAESLLTEGLAVAQAKGDKLSLTIICKQLAELAENRGDNRGAKASYTQSLHIARELGKKSSIADALTDLSRMAFQEGDAATARSLMLDSLALFREVGITFSIVDSLVFLARYALAQDEHATAYAYLAESLSLSVEAAYPWGLVSSLENFAVLIAARMRNDLTIGVRSTRLWAKQRRCESSTICRSPRLGRSSKSTRYNRYGPIWAKMLGLRRGRKAVL